MKRWIAMLLTVCMLISLCPVGVFAESATGGTEPAQTVQTEQSATGATGEKPAAAPENKEEPTPAPEGAENPPAAPASESNGNAQAENSGENAPVSEGGKNAPASESNGNAPAENSGEDAPAPEGGKNVPASESNGNAPAENSGENAPVSEGGKNAPAPESNGNAQAENSGENTPAPEGNGNVPADNGGATGATGEQNPQPEQKTCTCTKLCAQDAPNHNCEVCKDGDLTGCCRSEASTPDDPVPLPDEQEVEAEPEEPVCTCTAHCTADNFDQTCKACMKDVTKCHVSETQPVVDTYEFYVDGTLQDDWTQNLQEGEYLSVPGNPTKNGAVFKRWYKLDDAQNRITVESGAVSGVSGKTVRVDAEFAEFSYVLFMSKDGTAVVHTAQGSNGAAVGGSDRNAADEMVNLSLGPTEAVVGWSTNPDAAAAETIYFAAGTVQVYPVIRNGYWVTFDSNGGNYVAPIFARDGKTVPLPTATRSGYTFGGWYQDGQLVTQVSGAATLKAHWIAATETGYTVIHWQENANDEEYSFKESETMTGTTDEQTAAQAKSYEGFTAQPIEQRTIAGDGSTIVNVYYKRNVYTITFYLDAPLYDCGKEAHSHSLSCYFLLSRICGKKEHSHTKDCGSSVDQLKITAKYGQNISDKWPVVYGSSTWRTSENGGPYQVNIDVMPIGGKSFYGPKTGSSSETAYYYVEVLPGETGTISEGGISYKLHHSDTSPGTGYYVTEEDRYPITGFTFAGGTDIGEGYNGARFYYTRNSYDIVFINNGATEKTQSMKFEQSLSGVSYEPNRPDGVPEGYVFDGWYENQVCEGNAFAFDGKTMPAQNITLYAKWKAPEFTATVYLTVTVGGESRELSVPYGSSLKEAEGYEQLMKAVRDSNNGQEPSAWFSVDSDGAKKKLFNPDTKLYGDVTLVPHFSGPVDTFTVTYKEGDEGELPGPSDDNLYQSGSSATVLNPIHGNLRFLYWKDGNGKVYEPGKSMKMTGDVTLTACYTEAPARVALVYHNGEKTNAVNGLRSNDFTTVKSAAAVGFTATDGYTFAGWSTTPDGKAEYFAENSFFVPQNGAHLYAVWAKRTDLSYTVRYLDKDTDANVKDPVTYNGQTFDSKISVAQYKEDITGYTWISTTPEDTLTIGVESNVITLYYKRNTHQVSYSYTGTVPAGAPVAHATTTEKVESPVKVASAPQLAGYVFSGWSAAGIEVDENGFFTMPNHDVTFTGSWSARSDLKYTVKYVWNGQVIESNEVNGQTFGTTATVTPELSATTAADYTLKDTTAKTVPITANNEDNVVTFELRKKVTITVDNASKVFGQNDPAFTGTVTGLVDASDLGAVSYVRTNNAEAVGTYNDVLNAQYTENDNYNVEVKNGTFTITAKSIANLTVDTPTNHEYDGAEHKWAPTVTDKDGKPLMENEDYTVSYGKTDFTNVTGDITVTVQGIGNYTGTVTRSYKITPREAVITVNNGTKTAGRNDPAFTGTVTGLIGENDLGVVSYVRTNNAEAVGTYADVLTALYTENANYDVRVINGTFVITAANNPNPNPPQPNPNPPQPNPNPPQPQPEPEPEVEPEAGPEVKPEVTPEETQPAAPDAGPVEEIADEETPLAMGGAWALVNLILTVLTVLGSILLLIGYIGKKQKEREDENGNVILNAEGEAETDDIKKKGGWRLASIIPAVAAVIAFILTENMRLPMVLVDKWTLLMVIIALVQLLVAYFSKKKTQEPEQPEQMVANA